MNIKDGKIVDPYNSIFPQTRVCWSTEGDAGATKAAVDTAMGLKEIAQPIMEVTTIVRFPKCGITEKIAVYIDGSLVEFTREVR